MCPVSESLGQEVRKALFVSLAYHRATAQIPFPLGRFAIEQVAAARPVALQFARRGPLEALGGALVCFHFRHGMSLTSLLFLG